MPVDEPIEIPRGRSVWPLVAGYVALIGFTFAEPARGTAGAVVATLLAGAVLVDLLLRFLRMRPQTVVAPVLILLVCPAWGLAYSHSELPTCTISACDAGATAFRPLAEPEVCGLVALHLLTVLAYTISRRRPQAIVPAAEMMVHAGLLAGAAVHAVLAVHFAAWLTAAALLPPVFLPCAAPLMTVVLYGAELRARLRRRGTEAATVPATRVPDSAYREGPPQEPLPPEPRIHRPSLARAFVLAPALLGVHAVIHAFWLGRADGALAVVTRTCGYALSSLPVVLIPCQGHYLCTVAARGHAWLVKPERMGRRGGVPIVVNRQLALANAFEDLLHERWPTFGRVARLTYDRIGLPLSRHLQRPLLADLVYLGMKPAEWAFYVVLLLLDRGDPEARIDRMYR